VGIVAEMAMQADGTNADLVTVPAEPLFGMNVARIAFKRSAYLRNFVYKFAELVSGKLTRDLITKAMTGRINDYEV
jgi:LysR family cys regulon transcriptional activator